MYRVRIGSMSSQKNNIWIKVSCPRGLQRDFKVGCWLENTTITDKLLTLIHGEVMGNKKQIEEAKKIRG